MRFRSILAGSAARAKRNLLPAGRAARKFAKRNLLPAGRAAQKFAKDNPMKVGAGLLGLQATHHAIKRAMRPKFSFGFLVRHYSSAEEARERPHKWEGQKNTIRLEIAHWVRRAVWASWTPRQATRYASFWGGSTPTHAAVTWEGAIHDRARNGPLYAYAFPHMKRTGDRTKAPWHIRHKHGYAVLDTQMPFQFEFGPDENEFHESTANVKIKFKDMTTLMGYVNELKIDPLPPFLSEVVVEVHPSQGSADLLSRLWYATVFDRLIDELRIPLQDRLEESRAVMRSVRAQIKMDTLIALNEIHAHRHSISPSFDDIFNYDMLVSRQRLRIVRFLEPHFSGEQLFAQLIKECFESILAAIERLDADVLDEKKAAFIRYEREDLEETIRKGVLSPALENEDVVDAEQLMKEWEREKKEAEDVAKALKEKREQNKVVNLFPFWIQVGNALHYVFPLDDGFQEDTLHEKFCRWFHERKTEAGHASAEKTIAEETCEKNIRVEVLRFDEASRSEIEKELILPGASKIRVSMTEAELGEASASLHTEILQTDARDIFR